jgi:hypothetical protein
LSKKPNKPKSLHEVQVTKFLNDFYGKEKKVANKVRPSLAVLKDDYSLSQIIAVAKALDKHPAAYNYFYGTVLPKSYSELRNGNYTYQGNLEREFSWYVISILKFKEQINQFIQYRDEFESALLIGNYDLASSLLDQIEKEICFSFWGMQQRFLVAELSGSLKKNKDFLSSINDSTQDAFVTTFAYFFSNRAEDKMSVQRFNNFFNNFFQNLSDEIREYFQFVVNDFAAEDYQSLHLVLNYHNLSSVIDRYVTFIKAAQLLSAETTVPDYVPKIVQRVQKVVADRLIDGLMLFESIPVTPENFEHTAKAMIIFDCYSNGDYKLAIEQSKLFLLVCPTELSVYEIYIKAHLFLRKEFISPLPGENLISEILDNIYNVLDKNESTSQSLTNILKMATTLQDSSIGNQLFAFYNRYVIEQNIVNWKVVEIVNAQILNPLLVKRYTNYEHAKSYLANLVNSFPASPTVALFSKYLNPESESIQAGLLSQVPSYRITFYDAESEKERGYFDKAIKLYNELLSTVNLNIVLYEDALVNLLECYLKTAQYESYLEVYVSHYFLNTNLLIRVDTKPVIQHLQVARFRNVAPSILLPVFFFITKQDSHNINIALRVFLKSLGLIRSADLRLKQSVVDLELLKFLLYNIATPEILKYSTYFEGTNDILLERVEVLQILVAIDKANSSPYDAEISKITQDLAVSDAIRQIDESKIYVDEASLLNSEFSDVKNNFNRYIEISSLISDQGSSFIDISLNRQILLKITDKNIIAEVLEPAQVSKNVKFELFKDIFYEIRDAFLFNNRYGLDVYLSTRIRHGTLLGQFRNEFQTQQLITQKDKSTESYFRNEYWDKKLTNLDDEKRNQIQKSLADFSAKIDKAANDLKEKAIQIKTEARNILGLFDYTITNQRLLVYYDQIYRGIENYNEFVYVAIQMLWRMTDANLEYIRQYISINVKNKLLQYLSDLETELVNIVGDEKEIQELVNNIKTCRTQIHLELDKIADWFNLRRVTIPDFHISKVINSSLEITNKISQSAKITSPQLDIDDTTLFKGKYFIHLFDLLRIFLENIVNYSELESPDLKVSIVTKEENGVLHFQITNNLIDTIDRSMIQEKFTNKGQELSALSWDMNKIRTEKDTGFYKAKKNLTSDLQDDGNSFDFKLNDKDEVEINIYINIQKLMA